MADIESRFPDTILLNSVISESFSTGVTVYGNGTEHRNINWANSLKSFQVPKRDLAENIKVLLGWFRSAQGRGTAFRLKDPYDYKSSVLMISTISDTDQTIAAGDGSTLAFQLIKNYTTASVTTSRLIKKPVSGTTVISIQDVPQTNDWSVDTTTGIVTFEADGTGAITGITQAASAVVSSTAHPLSINDTVYFKDVVGMTEINGLRGTVTSVNANDFTVDINSSAFSAYSSAGTFHTLPQSGEDIKAGYEYDLKVRFDQDQLDIILTSGGFHTIDSLVIKELR